MMAATVPASTPALSSENEKKSLLAVLQFLKKNNLKEAEEVLRREAGFDTVSTDTVHGNPDQEVFFFPV